MKKLMNFAIIFALVPLFFLASCDKDDDDDGGDNNTDKFTVLKDYMVARSLDLTDVLSGWIVEAAEVNTKAADDYYFIDIRKASDFDAGHINGAVNATLSNLLDMASNATKPIVVVCYTGQTAGHAVMALRLSGYPDAKVLNWGMSGWNNNFSDPWNSNTGDVAINHTNWADAPGDIAASVDYNKYPTITSTYDDGPNILKERVDALLLNGFNSATNTSVLDDPGNYCLNNYWDEADVTDYGNIKSTYRVKPVSLAGNEIKYLNPDKPVVTYCWTGQTSSMITAWLYVIGYDAKSLTFGANGMIYSNLHSHKWAEPTDEQNYPYIESK